MSPTSEHTTNCKQQQEGPEWVPSWLRKSRALPVASFCVIFAVCLEILNAFVHQNHGLSVGTQNVMSVNAARYLPTFGAVCLGFMWKALVQDTKKITPWSIMNGKWSKTSDSVGLDYITTIEPVTFFKAASRRHWAVFLGLLLGFVCGALVAVANSLTYVDLFATRSERTHLLQTTTLSYSGISQKQDGSLPMPNNHLGQKPYAAVAAERLPGGQSAPWSKDNYVFESFNSTTQLSSNTTIQATVKALHPSLLCHSIKFTALPPDESGVVYFQANLSNRPELNCSKDLILNLQFRTQQRIVRSWIETTACADNETDIRLLSMLAWYELSLIPTTTLAVLCETSFTTREAVVRADWITGDVLEYNFTSSPTTQHNTQTSMDAIYNYLNNPFDSRTQFVYNVYLDSDQILARYEWTPEAVRGFLYQYGTDPFSDIVTDHLSESVIRAFRDDPAQYREAVERVSNGIMTQVVNEFSRENSSQTIDGVLKKAEPRMFLRQQSLRIFQGLLCLLALACTLQTTILRPNTCLTEDPGSIASMAVLLATCEDHISDIFSLETSSTNQRTAISPKSFMWQLRPTVHRTAAIMAVQKSSFKQQTTERRTYDGFRPLSLRPWAKIAISGAILAVMVTESILLLHSHRNDGLYNDTAIASTISTFVPTVVLLLLGYACSGIDSSVRIMTPYRALSRKLIGTKSPLLFKIRDVPSIRMPFRALKNRFGSAVLVSSFAILLIPPLKITTAGLYRVSLVQTRDQIRTKVDISLIDSLFDAFDAMDREVRYHLHAVPGPNEIVESASQFAQWALNPEFNIPVRSGILANLVFSNITALDGFIGDERSLSRGEITARVPAIEVDVRCNTAPVALYGTYQNCSDSCHPWIKFDFACSTEICNSTINGTSPMLPRLTTGSKVKEKFWGNPKSRVSGYTYMDFDRGYQVLLVDWADAVGYVTNTTQMPFSVKMLGNSALLYSSYGGYESLWANDDSVILEPGMLNISLPELRAVKCYSNLTRVTVDTTFTRKKGTGWHDAVLASWSPVRFDASSIHRGAQYDGSKIPFWLAPYTVNVAGNEDLDGSENYQATFGDSLWPRAGTSGSFFELLASYGEYKLGNLSSILDPGNFVQASTHMYTAYTVNLLTELRSFASNASADVRNNTQTIEAEVVYPSARIKQDFATTIASECMLLVMFLCFAWVSFRFPSHAILPQNPGSIAARSSLLAHSRLVERLRDENIRSVKEAEHIWKEKVGLGWWPSRETFSKNSTYAVEEGAESDTGKSGSGLNEGGEDDGGEIVNGAGYGRIESGEVEDGEVDSRDAEYGAGNEEGDESSASGARVVDDAMDSSRGKLDGGLESAREEEGLLNPTDEQAETRPSNEETMLKGGNSGEHGLRWGIDIGEGMTKGSWRHPPGAESAVYGEV